MLDRINQIIAELKTNKPIQHIIGETKFYGLKLKVNEHTLIPRPETEELVQWILDHEFTSALDIGTGSGCISIAVKKNKNVEVSAIDVSKSALIVAKENAIINEVEINFLLQDILKTTTLPKVDMIISNPPYLLDKEKELMLANVLDNEPHLALFVPNNNPLLFYKKIAELSFTNLSKNGLLFFEINERFGKETVAMLTAIGFVDIELKKDINEKDRMIKAIKN